MYGIADYDETSKGLDIHANDDRIWKNQIISKQFQKC